MSWVLLWLEVLGIMAVVFAAGIGIGFLASWILRRGERRHAAQRKTPIAAPKPMTAPQPVTEVVHIRAPEAIAPPPSVEPSLQAVPYGPISANMRFPLNAFGGISLTRPDPGQSSN